MDIDLFEKITNAMAVTIRDNFDFKTFCISNFGVEMSQRDNSISHEKYQVDAPVFIITKDEEEHFFNKGTESGVKSNFPCQIVFFGDFKADQNDDSDFVLKSGTRVTVNGIVTYTPSDTMRKVARIAGSIINKEIACQIPQLRVESFKIFSEGFYDRESGAVGAILSLKMYQENRGYGN